VKFPLTVSVLPVMPSGEKIIFANFFNVIDSALQGCVVSIYNVKPSVTMTSSIDVGITPSFQVAGEFHAPEDVVEEVSIVAEETFGNSIVEVQSKRQKRK